MKSVPKVVTAPVISKERMMKIDSSYSVFFNRHQRSKLLPMIILVLSTAVPGAGRRITSETGVILCRARICGGLFSKSFTGSTFG
jgi:hypothetical protein